MAKQKVAQGSTADSDSIRTAEETRSSWRVVVGWLDLIRDEDERWCIEYRFDDDSSYAEPIVDQLTLAHLANEGPARMLEALCEQVAFISRDDLPWLVVFVDLQPSFSLVSDKLAAVIERVYDAEQLDGDRLVEAGPLVRAMDASRASWTAADGEVSA
jgi:hypothetical protein